MKSVYDMTTFKIQFMRIQLLTTIFVLLSVALPGLAQKRTFADAQKVAADFFQSKDNNAKVWLYVSTVSAVASCLSVLPELLKGLQMLTICSPTRTTTDCS